VVEQQNPDGLSSHLWNQLSLHRFFGHQPDRPAGAARGRVGAHHGDDPLFLVVVQYFSGAGSLLLIKSTLQSGFLVAVAESTNGLWGERIVLATWGALTSSANFNRAKARRTTRTCCTPPFSRLRNSCWSFFVTSILRGWRPIPRVCAETILHKNDFSELFQAVKYLDD
jgi:hypothetical protein